MLSTKGTREMREAAALFRDADKETQKLIRKASQQVAPILRDAAVRRAPDEVSRKIAASGKVAVSRKGITAVFGATGRVGSAKLADLTRPWEFGGDRSRKGTYTARRGGTSFRVTRRTQAQIPGRAPKGRFIYPAVADAAPQVVGAWVRAVVQAVTYA